jgi:CPA1 family monovalent cation:H+ antiporter
VSYLPRWLTGSLHEQAPAPRSRELTIIGWCGMRGIVSLVAALALPTALPNGAPFPARDLIIFLTFFVIATTLIGQGLTLAPLIRKLKVGADWSMLEEQERVRTAMSAAAIAAVDAHLADAKAPAEWADHLRAEIADRAALAAPEGSKLSAKDEVLVQLRRVAIRAKRRELLRIWRDNEISDEVMRLNEEILDYQEAQL